MFILTFFFLDGFSTHVRGDYPTVIDYFDAWLECKQGKREGLILRISERPHVSAIDLALSYRAEIVPA